MKHTKFFIFALVAAMTFSACGTDDTLQFYFPENGGTTGGGNTGGGTGGGNTGGGNTGGGSLGDNTPGVSTNKANQNMNMPTTIMPEVVKNAINGLEFPKIKGGSSYVVTHMADNAVNFSSEWDDNLQSQRWTISIVKAIKEVMWDVQENSSMTQTWLSITLVLQSLHQLHTKILVMTVDT